MRIVATAAIALAAAAALGACGTAREVEQSSIATCTRCHGFPPEQVSSTGEPHPSNASCVLCHADTVGSDGVLVAGGAHVNGQVDVTLHEVPFVDHGDAALAEGASCQACHGAAGGMGAPSCSECH